MADGKTACYFMEKNKEKIKNQERLKGGSQISTLHAIYESNSVVIFGKRFVIIFEI